MSESITIVFSMGWLAGVITTLVSIGLVKDERRNKRQSLHDSSNADGVLSGDGTRSGTNGRNKGLDSK